MTAQAFRLVVSQDRIEAAMRVVAGRAVDPARAARKATAELERGPLHPGELRVVWLDRAVGGVALVAGAHVLERTRAPGMRLRPSSAHACNPNREGRWIILRQTYLGLC